MGTVTTVQNEVDGLKEKINSAGLLRGANLERWPAADHEREAVFTLADVIQRNLETPGRHLFELRRVLSAYGNAKLVEAAGVEAYSRLWIESLNLDMHYSKLGQPMPRRVIIMKIGIYKDMLDIAGLCHLPKKMADHAEELMATDWGL